MKIGEALNLTLKQFRRPANQLARESGVQACQISRLRNGIATCRVDTLERLLETFRPEERRYFLTLLIQDPDLN